MTLSLPRDWWGYHWSPPHPRSITELIRAGTLDADLAATVWLLLEARVPLVVVSGPPLAGKSTLLTALLDFLPADVRLHVLRGRSEMFEWLPEAAALGWPGASVPAASGLADPRSSYLLAAELSSHLPTYTWGARAHTAIRATAIGYGFATTAHADSLAELLAQLQDPAVGVSADELRNLGVVLVVRMLQPDGARLDPLEGSREVETAPFAPGVRRRVVAAHYIRPLERDAGGHVQRRPPAVLATWNASNDTLDHFEWGIATELAARACRTAADFEREQAKRARFLGQLAARPLAAPDVHAAIAAYAGVSTASTGRRPAAAPPLAMPPEVLPAPLQLPQDPS